MPAIASLGMTMLFHPQLDTILIIPGTSIPTLNVRQPNGGVPSRPNAPNSPV
jgi:hypothetical protein